MGGQQLAAAKMELAFDRLLTVMRQGVRRIPIKAAKRGGVFSAPDRRQEGRQARLSRAGCFGQRLLRTRLTHRGDRCAASARGGRPCAF